jgi:hypothetical protein
VPLRKETTMKILIIATAVLLLAIIALLVVRYTRYTSWNKFLDDVFEQLAFDFIPTPIKLLLGMVLLFWVGSIVVTYFTQNLRMKDPNAKPLQASVPLNQLASASQVPNVQMPSGGSVGDQPGGGAGAPPPSPTNLQPTPEQIAAVNEQLRQIQQPADPNAQKQMDDLAKQNSGQKLDDLMKQAGQSGKPLDDLDRDKSSEALAAAKKQPGHAANPPAKAPEQQQSVSPLTPPPALPQLNSAFDSTPSHFTATSTAAPQPEAIALRQILSEAQQSADSAERVDKADHRAPEQYPLVVKTKGEFFQAKLFTQGERRAVFLRPCGDYITLPKERIAKILEGELKYPLQLGLDQ